MRDYFLFSGDVIFLPILPACGLALQERKMKKRRKREQRKSKADQGGVEPPEKAVKAMVALQRATPHPMGNWSCAGMGWLCMIPRRAHCALSMTLTAF